MEMRKAAVQRMNHVGKEKVLVRMTMNAARACCVALTTVKLNLDLVSILIVIAATIQQHSLLP